MSPNTPLPETDSASIDGDRYKVGVELEDVTSTARGSERVRTPRATNQPLRSMCFMVKDCKWCRRPEAQPRAELATVPEDEEESPAVNALRECLETLERDRLKNAEPARRRAGLVQRCLNMCGKAV